MNTLYLNIIPYTVPQLQEIVDIKRAIEVRMSVSEKLLGLDRPMTTASEVETLIRQKQEELYR